jgi:hypothetical protein
VDIEISYKEGSPSSLSIFNDNSVSIESISELVEAGVIDYILINHDLITSIGP